MKPARTIVQALVSPMLLVASALPVEVGAVDVAVFSDNTWTVYDASGTPLMDKAQHVCLRLNPTSPPNCPPPPDTPTVYNYQYSAWPDPPVGAPAKWIWAPNLTGTSSPAANQRFKFRKEFYLCDVPDPQKPQTISVAADNTARVRLNGVPVLTSMSAALSLPANAPAGSLFQNKNTLEVEAENAANPSDCVATDQYRCNPAGVLVDAQFADRMMAWPECPGRPNGKQSPTGTPTQPPGNLYSVGSREFFDCPMYWRGTRFEYCGCANGAYQWYDYTDACQPPRRACVTFEGPLFVAGTTRYGASVLPVPQAPGAFAFSSSNISAVVDNFRTTAGGTYYTEAYVESFATPTGPNQTLRLNNISMRFDFSGVGFTPATVTFAYRDLGGEMNLATNANPLYVGRTASIPSTLASVAVMPTPSMLPSGSVGTITFKGNIQTLLVGGQELWIDEVCAAEDASN